MPGETSAICLEVRADDFMVLCFGCILCVRLPSWGGSGWSVGSGKPPGRLQDKISAGCFISSDAIWVMLVGLGFCVNRAVPGVLKLT